MNIELDLTLHRKQGLALLSEATELGYGGAAGGGKSHLGRASAVYFCHNIPGLQTFLFRRQHNELVKNHMIGPTSLPAMLAPWTRSGYVKIVKDEIRFAHGSNIFLCHCFAGDTLIQTIDGDVKIKDLIGKTGLLRVTKSFTASFNNVRLTRTSAHVVTVGFDDGTSYRCTPDHRFITADGYIEARNLAGQSCLTNKSQLSVQKLRSLRARDSAETLTDTMAALLPDCIGSYGNIITVQSLKALRFITSMRTKTITLLETLSLRKEALIGGYMLALSDTKSRQDKPESKGIKHQGDGTLPQRATNGTKSRSLGFNPTKLIKPVRFAVRLIRDLLAQGIRPVQSDVGTSSIERKESLDFKRCESVEPSGTEDVYCMTVEDAGVFPLSNGVLVSNCQHEKDVFNWLGPEMHYLIIEQAEQFTPFMITMLRGRNRIPEALQIPEQFKKLFPRCLYTFNPGGPGHVFFKHKFAKKEAFKIERVSDEEGGKLRQFIPAKLEDNPSVDPKEYEKTLSGLPLKMRKALRDGDFDTVIGAFFPQLDRSIHLIRNMILPAHLPRFMAYDHGAAGDGDPFSIGWYTVADGSFPVYSAVDGRQLICQRDSLICYRRWNGRGLPKMDALQIANGIKERERGEPILFRVAGGDIIEQRGHGESIFGLFAKEGINFRMADRRRQNGWAQVDYRLSGRNGYPLSFWFEDCEEDLETIGSLQHDATDANDIAKGDDHDADRHRYACMTRPVAQDAPITKELDYRGFNERATVSAIIDKISKPINTARYVTRK